jgi:CheY-like chemotaxis protein
LFLCVIEHSRGVSRATPPDPAGRSIIACWLDEFFGRAGIEHASSGAEALKVIDERCPDLVLAAHPLPGVGGTEITAIIIGSRQSAAIVVIASGPAINLDLQCRAAGVDLILEKRHLRSRLLAFPAATLS